MGLTGQNFNWRPNDNSASTRIKYDLEAEHWVKAFENSKGKRGVSNSQNTARNSRLSISDSMNTFSFTFIILSELFSLLFEIFSTLFKYMISLFKK